MLDDKRLGKQRVEAMQLLNVLTNPNPKGWRNHPATRMWRGYEHQLCLYTLAMCAEWTRRGYKDTVEANIRGRMDGFTPRDPPHWMGYEPLHASHRSSLLRKDPEFYGRYGWAEECDLPYVWPPGRDGAGTDAETWQRGVL